MVGEVAVVEILAKELRFPLQAQELGTELTLEVRLLTLEFTSSSLANWPGRPLRLPGSCCQASESVALRRMMMTVFRFLAAGVSVVFMMIVRVFMPGMELTMAGDRGCGCQDQPAGLNSFGADQLVRKLTNAARGAT